MKKDSKSRNLNKELYWAFDYEVGIDDEKDLKKVYDIFTKYNTDGQEDTRYYGLFIGKDKKVRIDPKRYDKMIGLSEEQLNYMNKRITHYFYPEKQNYKDYYSNYIREQLKALDNEWHNDFKPMIERTVKRIKSKSYSPGDDMSFHQGISSHAASSARMQFYTMMSKNMAINKKQALITSLYSQFFQYISSQIEKLLVKVLSTDNKIGENFNRCILYDLFKERGVEKIDIKGYFYFDRMYRIWNFIKHNNKSTYKTLKQFDDSVLINTEYKDGNNAIHYVNIDSFIIENTIENLHIFMSSLCKIIFNEDYENAIWNYDTYFLKKVKEEVDFIKDPLGSDMFDDID